MPLERKRAARRIDVEDGQLLIDVLEVISQALLASVFLLQISAQAASGSPEQKDQEAGKPMTL